MLQDRYTWKAVLNDGTVMTKGADLSKVVKFSLIPNNNTGLPSHDIVGVPLVRRFCRGFSKVQFANTLLEGLFFWEHNVNYILTEFDQTDKIFPGEMIGKGVAGEKWYFVKEVTSEHVILSSPYLGKSKPKWMQAKKKMLSTPFEYVHCVVAKEFRFYIRSTDGTILITPTNYELYL